MLTRFIHAIAALRHGVARRHGSVDSTLQHRHTISVRNYDSVRKKLLRRRCTNAALSIAFSECGAHAPQVRDMRCAQASPVWSSGHARAKDTSPVGGTGYGRMGAGLREPGLDAAFDGPASLASPSDWGHY